jgi:hypothetical protein
VICVPRLCTEPASDRGLHAGEMVGRRWWCRQALVRFKQRSGKDGGGAERGYSSSAAKDATLVRARHRLHGAVTGGADDGQAVQVGSASPSTHVVHVTSCFTHCHQWLTATPPNLHPLPHPHIFPSLALLPFMQRGGNESCFNRPPSVTNWALASARAHTKSRPPSRGAQCLSLPIHKPCRSPTTPSPTHPPAVQAI